VDCLDVSPHPCTLVSTYGAIYMCQRMPHALAGLFRRILLSVRKVSARCGARQRTWSAAADGACRILSNQAPIQIPGQAQAEPLEIDAERSRVRAAVQVAASFPTRDECETHSSGQPTLDAV
jgi:hypothetical protein